MIGGEKKKNEDETASIVPVLIIGASRSGTRFLRDLLGASNEISVVPYDIGYIWKRGNERIGHDELEASVLTCEDTRWIRNAVKKMAIPKISRHTKFLVEKTVSNTLRIGYVNAIFTNGDQFTYECMGLNSSIAANQCALLNFNERANETSGSNHAAIQIDRFYDRNANTEFYITNTDTSVKLRKVHCSN